MLWLAKRHVCMRVCKHGCDIKMFCFSCANHASSNLKSFWVQNSTSFLYLPIPSLAETWKILANKLWQFCFCLYWHFCLFIFFVQKKTKYTSAEDKISYINKTINATTGNYTLEKVVKPGSKTVPDGTMTDPKGSLNVLGLVVFSIVFGVVLGRIGERGMPLKAFFEALNEVIMKMVALVMW